MNRLVAYRAIEGISQTDLAKMLKVTPQMVSLVESGRRSFTGDLSALGYDNLRLAIPDMSEPLHRQRASTSVAARRRAQELLRLAGEVFRELRERTERVPTIALEPTASPVDPDEIDDLALDARCMLQHEPTGPIQNLTSAVERAGVCVVPIVGLEGIDGISSWVDGIPVIGLNPNVPGDRFRLSLGHELGHLLFHKRKTDASEGEANRFSSALLFPREQYEAVLPERPQLRDFVGLKSSWGVSVAALVYRAHELNIIDDQRFRSLQIQMSRWRRNEPGRFAPTHGELFRRLIDINGGADSVSLQLGVNRKHLHDISTWSHLRAT